MAYIDVRAADRRATLPDAESAILQVVALRRFSKDWTIPGSFGQSIGVRRRIDAAVKAKDVAAFKASQRRGYWRVELA